MPFRKQSHLFENADLATMREAFDGACAELGLSDAAHDARERIASAIVEAATNGERDPAVLKNLGIEAGQRRAVEVGGPS